MVATFAEHIELVIGIESLIQLESSLFLADLTLSVTPRSIPLYPTSEVTLVPKEQTLIYLQGTLPNQFSSGYAITHILPLDPSLSILTVESEFINQSTCFLLKNTSDRIHTFTTSTPLVILIQDLLVIMNLCRHHKFSKQNLLFFQHPPLLLLVLLSQTLQILFQCRSTPGYTGSLSMAGSGQPP